MSNLAGDQQAIRPEGLQSLKDLLATLEGPKRIEIAKRIKAAREEGDLKENAEYHQAKDDQAHLETKILRLTERLRSAVVIEMDDQATVVTFGRPIIVTNISSGKQQTLTIVGPTEADPKQSKISSESPVAKALLGASPDSEVEIRTPAGLQHWRIDSLVV